MLYFPTGSVPAEWNYNIWKKESLAIEAMFETWLQYLEKPGIHSWPAPIITTGRSSGWSVTSASTTATDLFPTYWLQDPVVPEYPKLVSWCTIFCVKNSYSVQGSQTHQIVTPKNLCCNPLREEQQQDCHFQPKVMGLTQASPLALEGCFYAVDFLPMCPGQEHSRWGPSLYHSSFVLQLLPVSDTLQSQLWVLGLLMAKCSGRHGGLRRMCLGSIEAEKDTGLFQPYWKTGDWDESSLGNFLTELSPQY